MSKIWLIVYPCLFLRVPGWADSPPGSASPVPSTPWSVYEDPTFHYRFSYPVLYDRSAGSDFVVIDRELDPVFICAAPNHAGWSSKDFFDHWRHQAPEEFAEHCADYPSYAQWNASTATIAGRAAEEVRIQRGSYRILCTYVATPNILWAACSPPEKASSPTLQKHLEIYNKILESLEFPDQKKNS
jgi:hypothetical protein